jgi:hypothetical protein
MPRDRRLFVSVLANGFLAAGLIWSLVRPAHVPPPLPTAVASRVPVVAPGAKSASSPRGPAEAAEWPQWMAELRIAGVPNRVLASVVLTDFDRRWEQTQRKLQRDFDAGEIDSETLMRAATQHDREMESELRQALGETGFRAWQKDRLLHEFTLAGVPMSEEESDRIYQLRRTDEEHRRRLGEAQRRGEIDSLELSSRLGALDSDYQAKLVGVLGEKRINEMNFSGDGVEADVRRHLKRVDIPSGQVEELADVQRARDILQNDLAAHAGHNAEGDPAFEARRLAIDAARDQAFERILGSQSFAEWQKSRDPRFLNLRRYATAWQLNEAEVASVYASIQTQENRTRGYRLRALSAERQGVPTDWAAVQNQIDELAQQTEQSLRRALGDERFERLKRNEVLTMHP